jgi:hypothetical protein
MAFSASRTDYSPQAIYLYVVPLRGDFLNGSLAKPFSVTAHMALCIQGICHEVRARDKKTEPNEANFFYKWTYEQDWRKTRNVEDNEGPNHLGYMTHPYDTQKVYDVGESR